MTPTDSSSRFEGASAEAVLAWVAGAFPGERRAICTSFQREGMVVLDLALRADAGFRVFTIDTLRLPGETLEFLAEVELHYGISVEVVQPEPADVDAMVGTHGADLFYKSSELRLACCDVRKVRPLARRLAGLDAWVTGLRRDQSASRSEVAEVEEDRLHGGITKVNPLARWTRAEVEAYITEHSVPQHPLYAQGYQTLGCAPCTRASDPGDDPRAGRWWWEQGVKECGLHYSLEATATGARVRPSA
ncbi:MAG: phosphoadenylyl-sulfate reductase [Candidatus Dormibacteria bacterium]